VRGILATCLALGALTLMPAGALAASDVATTEAYVRANYALTSTGHRLIPAARAKIKALRERLRSECPGIVKGSPQNEDSEKLTWEMIGAMTIAGYSPGISAAERFARAVANLRWSKGSLTRAVRNYVRQGDAEVHWPLPNVCADLGAWKASGYTKLPETTIRFHKEFYENYVGVGFMPKAMLAYVPASQRGLVQRARRYEEEIAETEAFEVETFGEIIDLLGLNQ